MRIVKSETVVRYQVEFTPKETRTLLEHQDWRQIISTKSSRHNGYGSNPIGKAMLTKRQINDACDVLGINGREFMHRSKP